MYIASSKSGSPRAAIYYQKSVITTICVCALYVALRRIILHLLACLITIQKLAANENYPSQYSLIFLAFVPVRLYQGLGAGSVLDRPCLETAVCLQKKVTVFPNFCSLKLYL
ncbi:hypothetical protein DCC62_01785 [candidate division KSB1 bacterium]|nr:MAG: hypothetical protein DCC62_01785 [candidate division KSB1 bacterium]